MKKVLVVILILVIADLVILGLYTRRLRRELQGKDEVVSTAQAEALKAGEDLAAAKAAAEKALGEKGELEAKVAELQEEVERQKASTASAWESRQALFDELAALETKLNEELEKLAKSDEEDEERDDGDIEGKQFMEVMKAMFTQDFMKTAMRMQVPMRLKMQYGKFLDEHVQDPAQRAEVEAVISELLQGEMDALIDAFGAYPDMSKLKSLEANQEANKDMLKAALSTVLDGSQMAAFEERGDGRRDMEEFGAGIQAQMSGMKLNEEQTAAYRKIVREESRDSMDWPPTDADKLDELSTMTVGDFIDKQMEQMERTALRLAEVLPAEEVEKYRAFAERQMEMFKMQLKMFTGG